MTGWWYRDSWPWPLWQGGVHRLPPACGSSLLLTFDDGPSENSLRVSSLLAERALKAVFFLQGERAAEHPEMVRKLIAAGHRIGSHGLRHVRHGRLSPARVTLELTQARQLLEHLSGQSVPWFRPPYGSWAPWLHGALAGAGQRAIFWNLNPKDHAVTAAAPIVDRVLQHARPADILLLHCTGRGAAHTLAALPGLLDGLESRGIALADPFTTEL